MQAREVDEVDPDSERADGLKARLSSLGGGPSTVRLTTSSPRSSTNPSTRLVCRSSSLSPFLGGSFLNSSASDSTRFMCLSNAMNRPTICRPSAIVTRMR